MGTAIRVLVVEDRASDAEVVIRELRRAGFEPEWQRVETEPAFRQHLVAGLDLILSDYDLPSFNGLRALALLKESGLDVPFILVSGTIGEETAVAAIKLGAADYLLKDRLPRLGASVAHAIAEVRMRGEQRRMDLELQATQVQLQQLLEHSPAVLYGLRIEGDRVIPYMGSANVTRLLGFTVAETLHAEWWRGHLHPDDVGRAEASIAETMAHGTSFTEYRLRHKDGAYRWVADHRRLVRHQDGTPAELVGVWTEITERKQAERALEQVRERLELATKSAHIGVWDWDIATDWLHWDAQMHALYGSSDQEFRGSDTWQSHLHPEDRERASAALAAALDGSKDFDQEFRVRWPTGEVRHIEGHAVVQRAADGSATRMIGVNWDITDRKQSELGIKRLAAIVESSDDAIVSIDSGGIVTTWNAGATTIYGFGADEMVGTTMARLIPQDRPGEEQQILEKLSRGESIEHFETQRRCKDGRLLDVSVTASPIRDGAGKFIGVAKVARDISAQRKGSEALRASEQRFKALFEQAAVGVAQVDAVSGRFVQVNQRFCSIIGRSSGDLLEQLSFGAVTSAQDAAHTWEMTRQLLTGPTRERTEEKSYVRDDGREVWATVTTSPMWAPGEAPTYLIAVVQDITERKQLEGQFRQAQKMEAIGTLAGGIAHDFNNVLAAINGFTELSQMTLKENPEVREYLGEVLRATARATDLIRQILAFSRQQKPERKPIRLEPIVTETLKLLRASIPSTIEFVLSLTDAPVVLADASQLHQVLMNLGTNAWHAMKDRPGKLQVKLENVVIDASTASSQARLQPGTYAHLSVTDSGAGMDAATMRRIFEPFFTTKPVGEGTGLGLAVVHGIMASHDGAVTVDSQPGAGTAFHLYFPALAETVVVEPVAEGAVPRGHGERILLVDDEEPLVRLGEQVLTALGYEVEVTTDSAVALAMLRADPGRFALVLTDQTMPRMTGFDLAVELRQLRPGLPVVLMTGDSLSLSPERIKAVGICQLVLKPTTIHSLGSAVHAALGTPVL